MRFYTRRCPADHRTDSEGMELAEIPPYAECSSAQRRRLDELHTTVSNQVEIIDGSGTRHPFPVHENDADFIVAALNAADRQERLCGV